MAANPQFTTAGNTIPVQLTVANTGSDGSGSLTTIVTSASTGTRVDAVTFRNGQATQAASSAMLGKIFLSDAAGANPRLVGEVTIAAATRSATVLGATTTFTFSPPLVMKSGQILYTCISVHASAADDTSAIAFAGDF